MKRFKAFLARRQHLLPLTFQRKYFKSVRLMPARVPIGRALVSYSMIAAGVPPDASVFDYHSGPWESSFIVSYFLERGYIVDVIHYTNRSFLPKEKYDVIFTLMEDLYRLVAYAPNAPEDIVKIWHMNLSSIPQTNSSELERIAALEARRPGALYFPKRQEMHERLQERTMTLADSCIVVGNQAVRETYPVHLRDKIDLVTISASPVSHLKTADEYVPTEREFVWYFGNGAVRKGLDIVLEAFSQHPEWKLNIVGQPHKEPDFAKIYRRELTGLPNVQLHGHVNPKSGAFTAIMQRCFCFIAPTCTESISTAVATMLQVGLYPLISRETGVDLPEGAGRYFTELSVAEVERLAREALDLSEEALRAEISATQAYALRAYSREAFAEKMSAALARALARGA